MENKNKVTVIQADITTMAVDAIVNSADDRAVKAAKPKSPT